MDYMMIEPYTNECKGFVSGEQVRKELNLDIYQFRSMIMYMRPYHGCILIEDESEEEKPKREVELYQLVKQGKYGRMYYVTNFGRALSIKDGKETELKRIKKSNNSFQVKISGKHYSLGRLMYEAFIGKLKDDELVFFEGGFKLENLKKITKSNQSKKTAKYRKVKVGDKIYDSILECANDVGYSYWTIQEKLSGRIRNDIGVEYV